MKATKIVMNVLLFCAVCFMGWILVDSVVTPINFEEKREVREVSVVKNLVALRTAQAEFKAQKGRYIADLDSLVDFLRTTPKKEVYKVGSLTEQQLESGMTEHKAVKILETAKMKASARNKFDNADALYEYVWANDREVIANKLQGFRRDTLLNNMIEELYKGEYNAETIGEIIYIPYTDGQKFECEVNDTYTTSQGIRVPLVEIRAHYDTYLADLNNQERVNLIDKETKLDHYPGLKIGDVLAPNNNAGNWE